MSRRTFVPGAVVLCFLFLLSTGLMPQIGGEGDPPLVNSH